MAFKLTQQGMSLQMPGTLKVNPKYQEITNIMFSLTLPNQKFPSHKQLIFLGKKFFHIIVINK